MSPVVRMQTIPSPPAAFSSKPFENFSLPDASIIVCDKSTQQKSFFCTTGSFTLLCGTRRFHVDPKLQKRVFIAYASKVL